MPGTNLTRDEAATRARCSSSTSYTVDLDLTTGDGRRSGRPPPSRFGCAEPGSGTFADLVGATIHEITLNGAPLDPATAYVDSRIELTGLAADNELVVLADCTYCHTGEGLHRFVDPADGRVYLYSQFEVPDARRVYTTFEQPDLKARFTFTVTAPDHWKVVSNAPTPEPEPVADGAAVWRFPATKPMSTYITAIVAGEYHEVARHLRGQARRHPAGPLLPPVARRAPRPRRDGAADQARASSSSRRRSATRTRSRSTTSSTCRSTTWARWRTPAA